MAGVSTVLAVVAIWQEQWVRTALLLGPLGCLRVTPTSGVTSPVVRRARHYVHRPRVIEFS